MAELIYEPFVIRALAAGLLLGFCSGLFGVFIVQKRMSFLGDGLAHSAFGGVALGLLLQAEPMWLAVPFTLLTALGISFLKDKTRLEADTSIGIFFAVSVALGIVFISLNNRYSVDAFTYLFGSILTVTTDDLWYAVGLFALTCLSFFGMWSRWAYAAFDAELAKADGLPVRRDDYMLSMMTALTVVVSVKVIGIVLASSFLVIPAATARLVSKKFFTMTVFSALTGCLGTLIGLVISIETDLPTGAVIILVQAVLFVAAALVGKFALKH